MVSSPTELNGRFSLKTDKKVQKGIIMKINLVIPERSIWSFVGLLMMGTFTWFQTIWFLIPGFKEIYSLGPETINNKAVVGMIWFPIIAYILIIITVGLCINIFKSLKDFEDDLAGYFIVGLSVGLVIGIITGITLGLVKGIISIFFVGFIGIWIGLVKGFLYGLTISLVISLLLILALSIPQIPPSDRK
jgi:hypothetical protein